MAAKAKGKDPKGKKKAASGMHKKIPVQKKPLKKSTAAQAGSDVPKKISIKTKRRLAKKQPQVVEGPKSALFLRGHKTSQEICQVVRELRMVKAPLCVPYTKKNDVRPFEDHTSLEFFSSKTECSLFCLGSHTKKRPNNLIMGRMFDHTLLDMYEFGVTNFRSIETFTGVRKPNVGTKPCIIFQGEKFEFEEKYKRLLNFFLDFFHGEERATVNLVQLDHVIVISCNPIDDSIFIRHYSVDLKKSGTNLPKIVLNEVGPAIDLALRRVREAPVEMWRKSMERPREQKPRKVKNVSTNMFGQKLGTVHMNRQDFDKLNIKKSRALTRSRDRKEKDGEKKLV